MIEKLFPKMTEDSMEVRATELIKIILKSINGNTIPTDNEVVIALALTKLLAYFAIEANSETFEKLVIETFLDYTKQFKELRKNDRL
jgi:hypothetical protein